MGLIAAMKYLPKERTTDLACRKKSRTDDTTCLTEPQLALKLIDQSAELRDRGEHALRRIASQTVVGEKEKRMIRMPIFLCSVLVALTGWLPMPALAAEPQAETETDTFAVNDMLDRGISLGTAFEAPEPGAWGMDVRSDYFQNIVDAGFDCVRVP